MDTAHQWPQEIVVNNKAIEEIVGRKSILERKIVRAEKEQGLKCPRCNSSNTKFCYYNNYSLTQPRYFCKTCRRYWTEGGSLRNIPVGGGSRKNKKPSSSSTSSSTSTTNNNNNNNNNNNSSPIIIDHHLIPQIPNDLPQNPKIPSQDLNLSFPTTPSHHHFSEIVVGGTGGGGANPNTIATSALVASTSSQHQVSAMELLAGMTSNNNSRGLNCFIPMRSPPVVVVPDPGMVYTTGFPDLHEHQQFKSSLGFSLDGYGDGVGIVPTVASNGAAAAGSRLLQLPLFEDLTKQGSNNGSVEEGKEEGDHHHSTNGYWTGMLSEGSW